jgi:hypothetical protein
MRYLGWTAAAVALALGVGSVEWTGGFGWSF